VNISGYMNKTTRNIIENQYFNTVNSGINIYKYFYDVKINFQERFWIANSLHEQNMNKDGDFRFYFRKTKFSGGGIIVLSIYQEFLGIVSENWLFAKIKSNYFVILPSFLNINNYNRRCKILTSTAEHINQGFAGIPNKAEDIFKLNSLPVTICKLAGEQQNKVCRNIFKTSPNEGCNAMYKQYYIGYLPHLTVWMNWVYQSMELTKVSQYHIFSKNETKYNRFRSYFLLSNKGYLSTKWQPDQSNRLNIELQYPKVNNQRNYNTWPWVFASKHKRIGVIIAQICHRIMLKRNYAETFVVLRNRIIAKVAAVKLLLNINHLNGKAFNPFKHSLSA
jgi:hypothetical protein